MYADPDLIIALAKTEMRVYLNEAGMLHLLEKKVIGMDGFRYCFKEEAVASHARIRKELEKTSSSLSQGLDAKDKGHA